MEVANCKKLLMGFENDKLIAYYKFKDVWVLKKYPSFLLIKSKTKQVKMVLCNKKLGMEDGSLFFTSRMILPEEQCQIQYLSMFSL